MASGRRNENPSKKTSNWFVGGVFVLIWMMLAVRGSIKFYRMFPLMLKQLSSWKIPAWFKWVLFSRERYT